MALTDRGAYTNEETLTLCREEAEKQGADLFTIKVMRLKPGGFPETAAILTEASIQHLANPETWLEPLVGGGSIYQMIVTHRLSPAKPIGGKLQYTIAGGTPHQVNRALLRATDWPGPKNMIFPTETTELPGMGTLITSDPNSRERGGQAVTVPPTTGTAAAPPPGASAESSAVWARLNGLEQTIAARERDLERRETELRVQAMIEARLPKTPAAPAEHKNSLAETLTAIAAVVTPLAEKMFAQSHEIRLEMMKRDSDARTEALRREELARAEATAREQAWREDLKAILERADKVKQPADKSLELVKSFADVSTTVMEQSLTLARAAAQLQSGPDDPPAVKVIDRIADTAETVMQALAASKKTSRVAPRQPPPGQPAQLPAGQQQPPAPPAQPARPTRNVVQELVGMVKQYRQPKEVAKTFVDAILARDPQLMAELAAVNNEPTDLFEKYADDWLQSDLKANVPYMTKVANELTEQAIAAGVMKPAPIEEPDDEPEEEDETK